MPKIKLFSRELSGLCLLSLLLLLSSIASADEQHALQQGEELIVLSVENMT